MAKIRLADEYDAAQACGEVASDGGDRTSIPDGKTATVAEIDLTGKEVFEARQVRDAALIESDRAPHTAPSPPWALTT